MSPTLSICLFTEECTSDSRRHSFKEDSIYYGGRSSVFDETRRSGDQPEMLPDGILRPHHRPSIMLAAPSARPARVACKTVALILLE